MIHSVAAATLSVCSAGCDYSSIQDAVDAASPHDIIDILGDVYYENVIINKSLTLYGENGTLLLSQGSLATIRITESDVTLNNIRIAYNYYGVLGEYVDNIKVENCIFDHVYEGIRLYFGHDANFTGNVFTNSDYGIELDEYSGASITENEISKNNYGMNIIDSMNNTFQWNIFSDINSSLMLEDSHMNLISSNSFVNTKVGIMCSASTGNNISNNEAVNISSFISLRECAENIIADNDIPERVTYAQDILSLGNKYEVSGLSFIGSQFKFNLVDLIAPAGFRLLSDVLNVSFIYDISRKTALEFNSKYYAGSLAGFDTSTIGLYTYQNSKITGLTKAGYDGENASLYSKVIDALDMISFVDDYGVDADSDGLNEYLAARINALISKSGDYKFVASLYDDEDNFVAYGYSKPYLSPGINSVEIRFSGSDLMGKKSGTFTVHYLRASLNTTNFIMQKTNLYVTSFYDTNLFEESATTYDLVLNQGWNLISIPLQINSASSQLFSGLDYESVWAYSNGAWLSYSPTRPAFLNTLQTVNETLGVWVKMNSVGTLSVEGTVPSTTNISLYSGWNLVGYPSLANRTVTDALATIEGNYSAVFMYKNNVWYSYDPNRPVFLNTLSEFFTGYGYWTKMNKVDTWHIT